MPTILRNCAVLDATVPHARPGSDVVIDGDTIVEVSERPVSLADARVVDCGGRTVMPGLIDCHVHLGAMSLDLGTRLPPTLLVADALREMRETLARGFTTVRDAAGADLGLALAVEQGIAPGPRIFPSGRALSQTGGHGDFRSRFSASAPCACGGWGDFTVVVDGTDAVRAAAREELRRGATQLKLMVSGGVASPTDPIDGTQYSVDEIRAAVEEARARGTYVMVHAYTADAIARAVRCGVRTVEHGNLVDGETAALMAREGAFAVPTLVTYDALAEAGAALGFPRVSVEKIEAVRGAGLRSLERFRDAGVRMGFGTDLLGPLRARQGDELRIRARVLRPAEILAAATAVGAEIVGMAGRLGVVAPGALADLLVVDGDPLADVTILAGQGERLDAIVQGGRFVKNLLA